MKIPRFVLAACLLATPLRLLSAQELPPATTPPDQAVTVPPMPDQMPKPHHTRHRRRHVVHLRPEPAAPTAAPAPVQAGSPGTAPAPMPNEDVGPPRAAPNTDASVSPGNLSIHYPPLGQAYLPGSSQQDMANTQTPKVPGVTVKVPLEQAHPEILPPPESH